MAIVIDQAKYPSFNAAVGQSGKRWGLYINYGVGATEQNPVWILLGGVSNSALNFKADVTTKATKDTGLWTEGAVTGKSAELTAEVVFKSDNEAQAAIEAFMYNDTITNTKKMLDVAFVDMDSAEYFRMKIIPTAWNLVANAEDMVTKSLTATVIGAPTHNTSWVDPSDNGISPTGIIVFDKAAQDDKTFALHLISGASVSAVKNGSTSLTSGTDYTLASNVLVIKKEYLATQSNGIVTLTVDCSSGTDPVITFAVTGTAV